MIELDPIIKDLGMSVLKTQESSSYSSHPIYNAAGFFVVLLLILVLGLQMMNIWPSIISPVMAITACTTSLFTKERTED